MSRRDAAVTLWLIMDSPVQNGELAVYEYGNNQFVFLSVP